MPVLRQLSEKHFEKFFSCFYFFNASRGRKRVKQCKIALFSKNRLRQPWKISNKQSKSGMVDKVDVMEHAPEDRDAFSIK